MSAHWAHTCGVCSVSQRQESTYPPGARSGTWTSSMMLKLNLASQNARCSAVQVSPKHAAVPYPKRPGSGGENCGAVQFGDLKPPLSPAQAGMGFFVQVDPPC